MSSRPPTDHTTGACTVSIITPAYNAAPYLAETVDSVLAQTYGSFELIIVDDGSTDQTAAIARRYSTRDQRVRLMQQKNRGIASARNFAMATARGRYFALLDSDDLWFPTYLAEQVALLDGTPHLDVLSANAINLGGGLHGELLLRRPPAGLEEVSLLQLVCAEDSMSIMSLFRREVYERIGGFDSSMRRSEDYDYWLRAAVAGSRLAVNPQPLGWYRRRPDSLSADEVLMLEAVQVPLIKLRRACVDRTDIVHAVDRQIRHLSRRRLVASARTALLEGNTGELAHRFSALADSTGDARYRVASWLSGRAPSTIWWAYRCKRAFTRLARNRLRQGPSHVMRIITP